MRTQFTKSAACALVALVAIGGTAYANGNRPPASAVGVYDVNAGGTRLTLKITSQTAMPDSACSEIRGSFFPHRSKTVVQNIFGFYCPGSGRIGLLTRNLINEVNQSFNGNFSPARETPARIGGVFIEYTQAGSTTLGEYNFSAVKQ